MNDALPSLQLCIADEATFWPWRRWPELANWPDKARTLVVVPIAGLADWGLGEALDAEETVLMSVLREASVGRRKGLSLLVLPPVRFTLGPDPASAFALDPDVACDLLEEVVGSVAAAGFTKVLLLNSNPWTEELCKAVGRDLRIARRLQMFSVHLSALGLDFHPTRGGERAALRSVLSGLAGDPGSPAAGQGRAALARVAARLASLFAEMVDKAPLAHGGELPVKTWP